MGWSHLKGFCQETDNLKEGAGEGNGGGVKLKELCHEMDAF